MTSSGCSRDVQDGSGPRRRTWPKGERRVVFCGTVVLLLSLLPLRADVSHGQAPDTGLSGFRSEFCPPVRSTGLPLNFFTHVTIGGVRAAPEDVLCILDAGQAFLPVAARNAAVIPFQDANQREVWRELWAGCRSFVSLRSS